MFMGAKVQKKPQPEGFGLIGCVSWDRRFTQPIYNWCYGIIVIYIG